MKLDKLDARTVAALQLPDNKDDDFAWDGRLEGFGYRVRRSASGRVKRSWWVQYKRRGATRRVPLGSAEVLGAEAARAAAAKILAKVALGQDPAAERRERRAKDEVSLKSMIDEYLLAKEARVRPRTLIEIKRYLLLGSYFKPLHTLPVDAVTRKDVAARLVTITREHSSIAAARARAALSTFFVWALQSGLVETNPVVGTPRPQDAGSRERTLSDDEISAIWRACGDDEYGRIIKLLILLGGRRSEIGGIAWSEIDLVRGLWTLPARRSKNGRAHVLPLLPMAVDIIAGVPRMASRDQLFGERAQGFTSWGRNKITLDERSGVRGWVVHDIRRSVATRMADLGTPPHIIEEILNHQSGHRAGIAGIYNRSRYGNEVRAALATWEDHVRGIITEGTERKVISLASTSAT